MVWGPEYAIDGKISKGNDEFFHSEVEDYPWIQLELEMCDQELSGITIVARSDCCADRLKNIEVRAGMRSVPDGFKGRWGVNTQAAVFAGPATEGQFYRINFGRKIQAKYITIQSLDKGVSLEINEVMLASEGKYFLTIEVEFLIY